MPPTASDPAASPTVMLCCRDTVGGVFRHVCDLSRLLGRAGIAHGILFDSAKPLPPALAAELARNARLGILLLPVPRAPHPVDAANILAVARFCRRHRIDVIHGHGAKPGLYARMAGLLLGRPAVYTPHGGSLHYPRESTSGRFYLAAERLLLPLTAALVFESDFARTEFHAKVAIPRCPGPVIHNGIFAEDFAPMAKDRRYDFIYLGLIREMKGVDVFLRAAARLERERGRPLRIAIFGTGPDEARFRSLAQDLGLAAVAWPGPSAGPGPAFATTDCLVLPSRRESLPYVVMEAAAAGVGVIATDVGGVREIVGPDYPLVAAEDEAALAARMAAVLDDPADAASLAASLHDRVARLFRAEHMAERLISLYRDLAAGRSATSAVGVEVAAP